MFTRYVFANMAEQTVDIVSDKTYIGCFVFGDSQNTGLKNNNL